MLLSLSLSDRLVLSLSLLLFEYEILCDCVGSDKLLESVVEDDLLTLSEIVRDFELELVNEKELESDVLRVGKLNEIEAEAERLPDNVSDNEIESEAVTLNEEETELLNVAVGSDTVRLLDLEREPELEMEIEEVLDFEYVLLPLAVGSDKLTDCDIDSDSLLLSDKVTDAEWELVRDNEFVSEADCVGKLKEVDFETEELSDNDTLLVLDNELESVSELENVPLSVIVGRE